MVRFRGEFITASQKRYDDEVKRDCVGLCGNASGRRQAGQAAGPRARDQGLDSPGLATDYGVSEPCEVPGVSASGCYA